MGYFKRMRLHGVGDDSGGAVTIDLPVDTSPDTTTTPDTSTSSDPGNTGTIADPADPSSSDEIAMNNPDASSFKQVGNICKPLTFSSLAAAQELQRQLNRVAAVKGFSKIAIDGGIGPGTMTLFGQVQGISASGITSAAACMTVGAACLIFASQIQAYADSIGAPTLVPAPSSPAPISLATAAGNVVKAPLATQAAASLDVLGLGNLSGTEQLLLAAAAVGVGYFLFRGSSKSKSKTKQRSR